MTSWLLDDLPPALANGFPAGGFVRSLAAGETLHIEGSDSDSAYVVLAGLIRLSKVSPNGTRALVAVRGRGDLVGQHSALDAKPRVSTVQALTAARLLCVPKPHFINAINTNSELAQFVLAGLCEQIRDTVNHIIELLDENGTVLVARRLLQLATEPRLEPLRRRSEGTVVIDSLSQSDLAGWSGVSQRSAGLALRELRNQGVIATGRLRVEILDLKGLRYWAHVTQTDSPEGQPDPH